MSRWWSYWAASLDSVVIALSCGFGVAEAGFDLLGTQLPPMPRRWDGESMGLAKAIHVPGGEPEPPKYPLFMIRTSISQKGGPKPAKSVRMNRHLARHGCSGPRRVKTIHLRPISFGTKISTHRTHFEEFGPRIPKSPCQNHLSQWRRRVP